MRALPVLSVLFVFVSASVLVVAGSDSFAADAKLRRAAIGSYAGPVSGHNLRKATGKRRSTIGLAPIPYSPNGSRTAPSTGESQEPAHEPGPRARHTIGLPDIRDLVRKINRSVVSIRMLEKGSSWSLGKIGIPGSDSGTTAKGYGSGFIISERGHIITNEHVLRHGSIIEVELLNGQKYSAKVLHKDSKNDLALIKIKAPRPLLPVQLGDSDAVELGEWVVGIGNPYGIGQTLMIGIVSAKKRVIPETAYPPLIQIDAAMNLGNSGGPLFNLDGEVIGINTIILWKSQGIGFATPVNICRRFLETRLSTTPPVRSASAPAINGMQPAADGPRTAGKAFNPLAPPWNNRR